MIDVKDVPSAGVTAELNISVWTANKIDRTATNSVLATHEARSRDAGQFRKNLMAGSRLRKDIADFAAKARLQHNYLTAPWADSGPRWLFTSLFMEHKEDLGAKRTTFWTMVDDYIRQYPETIRIAEQTLGKLFNRSDYPSADEVRSKFNFKLVYSPVAPNHWAVQFTDEVIADLSEQYEKSFDERLAKVTREPWNRLHKLLTTMSEKLTDKVGDEHTTKRYHETLITNAEALCPMLTHLNLTNDPKLEEARQQLEATMEGADIDQIKTNPTMRQDMKEKLDTILDTFEW
tara:strand:- start:2413 stop:3282 length:870 start_codon:yes stop_codon:yes gene_type:complete